MEYIIIFILAAIIGALIVYLKVKPQLQSVQELDQELLRQNAELNTENITLQAKKNELLINLQNLKEALTQSEAQAKQAADIFYKQNMEIAEQNFANSLEQERIAYLKAIEKYKLELEQIKIEGAQEITAQLEDSQLKLETLTANISELQSIHQSAVEAAKRSEEMKQKTSFYKINLSDIDKTEIEMLKNVAPYLRDKEPLNKVIWKVYYEKPTSDLIGRVIGSGVHTGIYKITNLENNMCYVGQAVNIADRWKQHIKRGLGAEAPTRNKLYPAMQSIGVENFSFEIIEECERSRLDQQEDYWQEYFEAKTFGYSIK